MNIEATKAQLKRYGEELQTKISKKQSIDDKDVPVEEKVTEVKEEEPVIRTGKKKQKARKGINVDKSPQGDSKTDEEESVEAMNPTPLDTKSNIMANWKIFQQGERSIYQIIRANRADTVYMSFGAMLKDFTREDLIEMTQNVPKIHCICMFSLILCRKRISDKRAKNQAKNDKTEHGMEKHEKNKVKSKPKTKKSTKVKVKTNAVIKEDLNGPTLTHLMGRGSPLRVHLKTKWALHHKRAKNPC
ncbi:hypothetical protein Tco_1007313 [Tanacetum coccineum]